MRKRGQAQLLYFLVTLLILGAIAISYKSARDVSERQSGAELDIFVSSLQAKALQQGVRGQGSLTNASFALPPQATEVCFFDAQAPFDPVSNVELTQLYEGDTINHLFIRVGKDYLPFSLDKVSFAQNPLCLRPVEGKLSLSLESTGTQARVSGASQSKCTTVVQSGAPEAKVDLVFLGYGYQDTDSFARDVSRFGSSVLLSFAPFAENRNKFNLYRVDNAELSCQINDYIACDQFQTQLAASNCPLDYAIVLVDRSVLADFVRPVRSSTVNGLVKLNTADRPFVIVHEFGHLFGLADEYVDPAFYAGRFNPEPYPNCAQAPCPEWKSVQNAGCFQGCSLDTYFRPTQTSVMRDLASPDFGPVNEREIERRLDRYE